MPRFSKSSRFAKQNVRDQPIYPQYLPKGMAHEAMKKGGTRIMKPIVTLTRDQILHGQLDDEGYFYKEERTALGADIGYLNIHTGPGKPKPTLRQRSTFSAPKHPNDKRSFIVGDQTLAKQKRFLKSGVETDSPGPAYFPNLAPKSSSKKGASFAYGPDKDGGKAVIQRGPLGKKIVQPRSRDRAWWINAATDEHGYMYKHEDACEIASNGHLLNNDVINGTLHGVARPSVAGLGAGVRFRMSTGLLMKPGPKYFPKYTIDSRKNAPIAHRWGTGYEGPTHGSKNQGFTLGRNKAIATGIIKNGVLLHQGASNINCVAGPGSHAPKRLFDDVKKVKDLGFGECQLEWMIKQEKLKKQQRKLRRMRRKMNKKKKNKNKKGAEDASAPTSPTAGAESTDPY
mmetsp:Transcript_19687/g.35126  ORF Transcript_19687/g.35126 Transcript_19687/m.35126 type:complete len:399 (+) Transcript_19687:223-1419(+)|eukprot:CAMPEP_0197525492 /NCGR_PEP_ID=MMETSP1318-20131121/12828_1 /TAXON_ID=552666 /ORGANISM="Partenskyella glossopodia, Strain RCC365" /LENGTH=398 /DNA_ID=CAMNT_0043079001 /DNA_START=158 /DNA_END=1354 /DNA_ORIENTATION=-